MAKEEAMHMEIERKFLVNPHKWADVPKPEGDYYKQGYLLADKQKSIRVRLTDSKSYLTIKGETKGAAREEFEYDIPRKDAEQLLQSYTVSSIEKIRYKIMHNGHLWEIDEFKGKQEGLILAEIELKEENEVFDIPDWVDKEVTGDQAYYNVNLAQKR